jgi:hypothetical protein
MVGVLSGLAFLVNAPGNLVGAWLQHRGVARWSLVVAGSLCMVATVWAAQDAGLPLAARIAAVGLFSATAGVVPSTLFNGVAAMTAGTGAAGSSVGVLMQGSSVGQLLVPPLVVAAGAASPGWAAQPAVLSGLALLAVLGGVLYRRWDLTHDTARGRGGVPASGTARGSAARGTVR